MTHSDPQGSSPAAEQSSGDATGGALLLAHKDPATGHYVVPSPIAGEPLTFRPGAKCLTEEQFMILGPLGIKREYDPGAVLNFLMDARARGFNPFSREIFLMQYKTRQGLQYIHHIGIHGMRRHVNDTRTYRGMKPVLFAGDDGKWIDVWPYRDATPHVCRVQMINSEWDELVISDAYYDEYVPMVPVWENGNKTDLEQPAPMWRLGRDGGKANLMIRKCATAGTFREGWSAMLGNWYDRTEMERMAVESDTIVREGAAAAAADTTSTRRAQAYVHAQGIKVVDGLEVGAHVLDQVDEPDAMPADRVRAMLLAERDAQAAITGVTPAFLTERWSEARGGADFDTWANLGEMAAHLQLCRRHVGAALRASGRAEMADRYAGAEMPATLAEMFGVDRVEALQMETAR